MIRKFFFILLVVVVGGYAAAEISAKSFAEREIERIVTEHKPVGGQVEADVSTPLIWDFLTTGSIKRVSVSTSNIPVGQFSADHTTATIIGVHLDKARTIQQRRPVIRSVDRLEMSIELSDSEVSKVLPEGLAFRFREGSVVLVGGGVEVTGQLVVTGSNTIQFRPDGNLPPGVDNVTWEMSDVPFVSCLRDITISTGKARVTCSVDNPPAEFPAV